MASRPACPRGLTCNIIDIHLFYPYRLHLETTFDESLRIIKVYDCKAEKQFVNITIHLLSIIFLYLIPCRVIVDLVYFVDI